MSNLFETAYTALNNLVNISADYIYSYDLNILNNATIKNLTVTNILTYPLNYMWSNLINQSTILTGTNQMVKTILQIILHKQVDQRNYMIRQ